jgi:hypothetical protein
MPAKPKLNMTSDINIDLLEYIKNNQKPKRVQSEEQRAKSIEALKKAREAKVAKKRPVEVKPEVKLEVKPEVTPEIKTEPIKEVKPDDANLKSPKSDFLPEKKGSNDFSSDNKEILKGIYELLKAQQQPKETPKPASDKPKEVIKTPHTKAFETDTPKPTPIPTPAFIPTPPKPTIMSNYRKPMW